MKLIALLAAILLVFATAASAQTTFRDGSGRITGTVSTDSNGTKTYRDNMGRTTGTTDSNGTTTYRDSMGRITHTATYSR
jgi:YD repeat-containing protein